jgi:tetratricopeptide (TPR) repeat protein
MYLRTPRRYQRGQKRSVISFRWLWLWLLTPVVVFIGLELYNNRTMYGPRVTRILDNMVSSAQQTIATAGAPTPLPTRDPSDGLLSARTDWANGRIEAAVSTYQQILGALPNDVEAHYRYAFGLAMSGKNQEALEAAERAITANPFSSDAWAIRSMMLDLNDRYGEAIASALRALELNPKSARATAFLAQAYDDIGQSEQALQTVKKALELDPKSFEALRVRGWLAWDQEFDPRTAKGFYEQAYNAAPNLPYLTIELARINLALEQPDEALKLAQEVIELNPQNALALYWLGDYYNRILGNYTQAAEYLSRCVQANPNNINCNALLGRVQMSLNEYQPASEALQKAIDLGSKRPRHHLWAARAYKGLGNCPAAVPLLQKGYQFAESEQDTEAQTAIGDELRDCQAAAPGTVGATTPEATAEATPG